jgi:hypothetical protein
MGQTSASDRDQLAGELEQARSELRASYQGLSEEQITRLGAVGEWSVKDVLSHVASWEEVMLPDLARLVRGDTPVLASMDLETADFDPFNAMIMSLRRNLPLDQVLRELDICRADVMAALARLPDAALAQGQFARFLLQITAVHDREHAEGIRQWRRKEGL